MLSGFCRHSCVVHDVQVASGEHIVAGEDIYGGTSRLLSAVVPTAGVSVSNVDMTDLSAVARAIVPGKTKLVIVESPTNPRMQVSEPAQASVLACSCVACGPEGQGFLCTLRRQAWVWAHPSCGTCPRTGSHTHACPTCPAISSHLRSVTSRPSLTWHVPPAPSPAWTTPSWRLCSSGRWTWGQTSA